MSEKRKEKPSRKSKNKRSANPYAGLDGNLNLKTRRDELDYDYLHKLSPEEKDWLNRFTEEEVNANFNHKGKKLTKDRKRAYDKNNARNRCIYTRKKASEQLIFLGGVGEYNAEKNEKEIGEDELNNKIDKKLFKYLKKTD